MTAGRALSRRIILSVLGFYLVRSDFDRPSFALVHLPHGVNVVSPFILKVRVLSPSSSVHELRIVFDDGTLLLGNVPETGLYVGMGRQRR